MASIQFLGAANTVTGSKYLIRSGKSNVLVDCGLFQGLKTLRLKNWDTLPIPAENIDAIILTHAHLDHSGYIPRLVKSGFKGRIYSTHATFDLCKILLPDAGYLAEEEASFLNRHKKTKHSPALPLFTYEEALRSLEFFHTIAFEEIETISDDFKFSFHYAGHILGAASVLVETSGFSLGFSGDIGRPKDSVFFPPKFFRQPDYLITESTYGNKLHKESDPIEDLGQIIQRTVDRNGTVVIPSFAVGRAQYLLYCLWRLRKQGRFQNIPVFLNSPMATNVNDLWIQYHDLHRLTHSEIKEICNLATYVKSVDESKALNEKKESKIIISASGMITGGRILHHIKQFGPDEKNTIVLAGYQAVGTRGESLANQARELKIHGEYIPINAEVAQLDNMSAHADYSEMIEMYKQCKMKPKKVFITHGDPSASNELRRRLKDTLDWTCEVPDANSIYEIK